LIRVLPKFGLARSAHIRKLLAHWDPPTTVPRICSSDSATHCPVLLKFGIMLVRYDPRN